MSLGRAIDSRFSIAERRARPAVEKGGVMIFFLFVIIAGVALLGLIVDVGRLLVLQRQLQNAADAGSLAGVLQLRSPYGSVEWAHSKLAVLAIVKQAVLSGLDPAADAAIHSSPETFRLDGPLGSTDCRPTANDITGYTFECGTRGNLTMRVSRGIWCFEDAPSVRRRWCSVEETVPGSGAANPLWLGANSVRVDVRLANIETTFARVFLIDRINRIGAQAISEMGPSPPTCGVFRCRDLGIPNPDDPVRLGGACE